MGYEYKAEDVRDFIAAYNYDTKTKGKEIQFRYCPYCQSTKDQYTFSINSVSGAFCCLRASCGKSGHFVELARDFNFPLDFGEQKQWKQLPQKKPENIRDEAVEYLASRGISKATCRRYYLTAASIRPNVLVFPFYDPDNVLQFVKYRDMDYVKGSKGNKEWCETNCKPILFGMVQCNPEVRTAVITEGQIDSLTLAECGIENALSVPTGCNGFTWVEHCKEWIEKSFDRLIIFGDHEKGRTTLVEDIFKRFKKCEVMQIPEKYYLGEKDANDIFRKYGKNAIISAVNAAEHVGTIYTKDLSEVENVDTSSMPKIRTMIPSVDKIIGGLFYGQLVLLSGKRGEGKSTFMSQLIANAREQDVKSYVYSGELPNYMFKNWLSLQIAGGYRIFENKVDGFSHYSINEDDMAKINEWYRDYVYILDNTAIDDEFNGLLAEIENQVMLHDIRLVCIDNLMIAMDTDASSDIYRAQSDFVKKLAKMARRLNIVIILVAHPKKGEGFDNDMVSGSADITNAVDVVMAYKRAASAQDHHSELMITKNRLTGRLVMANDAIKLDYGMASKRIKEHGYNGFEYSAFKAPDPEESEVILI